MDKQRTNFFIDALVPKRDVATSWNTVPAAPSASCHPPPIPAVTDQLGGNDQAVLQAILSLNTPTPRRVHLPYKVSMEELGIQWRWPLGEESTGGGGWGDTPASLLAQSDLELGHPCPSRLLQGDPSKKPSTPP